LLLDNIIDYKRNENAVDTSEAFTTITAFGAGKKVHKVGAYSVIEKSGAPTGLH
jgi:hypothetical protein